ncbi:MAG TPA: putative transporter small subunit [Burkholderiaceae bacterium]|nr:putative transporter small subunit [Burkholderiaceae bacterium]
MNELMLSAYILVWPAIAALILVMLVVSVIRDYRAAKETGEDMV